MRTVNLCPSAYRLGDESLPGSPSYDPAEEGPEAAIVCVEDAQRELNAALEVLRDCDGELSRKQKLTLLEALQDAILDAQCAADAMSLKLKVAV